MKDLSHLSQFTGTENYYRHGLNSRVVFTDGVQYFAEAAGAYWFLDILATEVAEFLTKGEDFIHVVMMVGNNVATISADDGNGKLLWGRRIDFTDCPDGEWHFYMTPGGPGGTFVIMLPSEY